MQTVALGVAVVVMLVALLIVDHASRWQILSLALLSVGFGASLTQWIELRRR